MSTLEIYLKRAIEYQNEDGNTSENAIEELKKGIEIYDTNADEEYNFIYANYLLMCIYANRHNINNALPYANKCLEILLPQRSDIYNYNDEGQFKEEVIRYASNTVAWHAYENATDKAELEKALELISIGAEYVSDSDSFYVLDTQVRILLKLDQQDEAFAIVNICMREDPECENFEDILTDSAYKKWLTSDGRFTDDEKKILQLARQLTKEIRQEIENSKNEIIEEAIPEKEFMAYDTVIEKYGKLRNIKYINNKVSYLVYHGDVSINGDFNEDWIKKQYNELKPIIGINFVDLSNKNKPDWELSNKELNTIIQNLPLKEGLYVSKVTEGGPSQKAGIEVGDIVVSINGVKTPSLDIFDKRMINMKPGDNVDIEVFKKNETTVKSITLGKRADTASCPKIGIIIDGHLKIGGNYLIGDSGYSVSYVYIKNGLTCNYIYAPETSFSFIDGGANIRFAMLGGSNGGDFVISGDLFVPYIINYDLVMNDKATGAYIGVGGSSYGFEEIHAKNKDGEELSTEDITTLLSDEALDDGEFLHSSFIKHILDGKNPFIEFDNLD